MKAKRLTVGPILGHTADKLVRIWGRAEYSVEDKQPRRANGVARIRKKSRQASTYSKPIYFKMNPNFDMTGVAIFSNLSPNTVYEYQVGWIYSGVNYSDIDVTGILEWDDIETFEFRTASSSKTQSRNIVLGSCRYALRLFGGTWFDDRGDKTFRSILERKQQNEIDQLIMCGDQIYADDLNMLGADSAIDEFNKRYREVFSSRHLRNLMARVPTYMTMDDHEIEDNWPELANGKDWVTKFPAAIHAYSTYQISHSPLFHIKDGRIEGAPTHLWYTYQDGCCDVFVCDTRTERSLDADMREIIGPRQLSELLKWLDDGSGRVKIIVTSVPPYESESSDKWHGFINQRDELFEFIRQNRIRKVLFLSGDVHACMSSKLVLDSHTTIHSIVSSALFWPYPHPKRREFKLSGAIRTNTSQTYKVTGASKVFPTDAFAQLAVSPSGVKVDFISRKNKRLGGKSYSFEG